MNTTDSTTRCRSNLTEIIILITFSSNRFGFMTCYYGKLPISLTSTKSQHCNSNDFFKLLSLKLYSPKLSLHSNFTKQRKDVYTHFNLYIHLNTLLGDLFFIQKFQQQIYYSLGKNYLNSNTKFHISCFFSYSYKNIKNIVTILFIYMHLK